MTNSPGPSKSSTPKPKFQKVQKCESSEENVTKKKRTRRAPRKNNKNANNSELQQAARQNDKLEQATATPKPILAANKTGSNTKLAQKKKIDQNASKTSTKSHSDPCNGESKTSLSRRKKSQPSTSRNSTPSISVRSSNGSTTPKQKPQQQPKSEPRARRAPKLRFKIKKVEKTPGVFYRKRNEPFAPIRLHSFIENNVVPTQFVTLRSIVDQLRESFLNLSLKDQSPSKRRSKNKIELFPDHITEEEVALGVKSELLFKGSIRINPKQPCEAYVGNKDTSKIDYMITTMADRNRALEGDEVVLQRKPNQKEKDRVTVQVVHITKKVHSRVVVGCLAAFGDEWAVLTPRDKRNPKVLIPKISWPNGFQTNPKNFADILYMGKILEWDEVRFAHGIILESVGKMGDLHVESMAILKEFCLDVTPFPDEMREFLPKSHEIPKEEFGLREDLRKQCVFTIDPLTARDLDDAMSCTELPNGNYEVGVHISDASFYLNANTKLDEMVKQKATTIYMVDNVYHMLPVELCLFCSLLPGSDKLAFSVVWELTEEGDIVKQRITRTIINSCCQLAYEHAQMMIDEPKREFKPEDLPKIHNGYTANDLSRCVNNLQKIAVNLRRKREDNGSLKINQVKISFSLDPVSREPTTFWVYDNKPAHRLIEEFMLLANMSVAQHIYDAYPELAFLRLHEPPKPTMMSELQRYLETNGIFVDISSAGSIQTSLNRYDGDDFLSECRMAVLNHLFAKPMQRAKYFCASQIPPDLTFRHYALSIPIYTHFTSPIRRYADIMVHRLLAASLNYCELPNYRPEEVAEIAAICNRQKYHAKRAGEASSDLYLAHFIEAHPNYVENAVVVNVRDYSLDAIVLKTGSVVRLYHNRVANKGKWKSEEIKLDGDDNETDRKLYKVTVTFPPKRKLPQIEIVLDIFTLIRLELTRKPKSNKLECTLLRPLPMV